MTVPTVTQVISSTGASTPIQMNAAQSPFNASFQVIVGSGVTASYSVQFTLDNLNAPVVTWTNDVNVGAGTVVTATGNYMFPIQGLRVNVASLSGGNLTFNVLQGVYPR